MNIPITTALQSRFTPMPTDLHIGFCVFATVVFLIIFLRRKTVSSIIWALICDATVILQFYNDKKTAAAVGICEIVLFAILIWVSLGERREQKRLEAEEAVAEEASGDEAEQDSQDEPDNLDDIAKLVRSERSKLADDDDDIIKNAFEDN